MVRKQANCGFRQQAETQFEKTGKWFGYMTSYTGKWKIVRRMRNNFTILISHIIVRYSRYRSSFIYRGQAGRDIGDNGIGNGIFGVYLRLCAIGIIPGEGFQAHGASC